MTELVALPSAAAALIASIVEAAAKSNSTWTIRLSATSDDPSQEIIEGFFDIDPSLQQPPSTEPASPLPLPTVQPIKVDLNLQSLQDTLAVRLRAKGITRKIIGGVDIIPYLGTFLSEIHLRGGPMNVKDWAGIASTLGMKGQNRGNLLKKFYQDYLTDDQLDNTVIIPAVPPQINTRTRGTLAAFTAPIPHHTNNTLLFNGELHAAGTLDAPIPAAIPEELQIAAILPATKAQPEKRKYRKRQQHPQTPPQGNNNNNDVNDEDDHEVTSKTPTLLHNNKMDTHTTTKRTPNNNTNNDDDDDDYIIENDNILDNNNNHNNKTPVQGNDDYHFPESDGEYEYDGPRSPGSKRHRAFAAVASLCDDLMEERMMDGDEDDDEMDVHVDDDENDDGGRNVKNTTNTNNNTAQLRAGGAVCLPFLEPWLPVVP